MSGSSGGVAAAGGDGGGSLEGIHNYIGDKYKQLSDDKGSHLNVRNQNSFNLKKMKVMRNWKILLRREQATTLTEWLSLQLIKLLWR